MTKKKEASHNPTGNNKYNNRWSIRHNWLVGIVSNTLSSAVGMLNSNRNDALMYKDNPGMAKATQVEPCVHVWSEPSVSGRPLHYVSVDELFLQVVGYEANDYESFWQDYEGQDTSNNGQRICRVVWLDGRYLLNPVRYNKKTYNIKTPF